MGRNAQTERHVFERSRCEAFFEAMKRMHIDMVGDLGINMDMKKWTEYERTVKINIALEFATFMHLGQEDKTGRPYIEHPLYVASIVSTLTEKIVAVLHDTIEDTELTLNDLRFHFPNEIILALDAISKRKGETYRSYIERVSDNRLARAVKIADLKHNMSKERWCFGETDDTSSMWKRYSVALEYLILIEKKDRQFVGNR